LGIVGPDFSFERSATMNKVELINGRHNRPLEFVRVEDYKLQLGSIVTYEAKHHDFRIRISREGIALQGSLPWMPQGQAVKIMNVLGRAAVHLKHLESFPLGVRQTLIPESAFDAPKPEEETNPAVVPVEPSETIQ
jgi:hypothetical protein